MRTKLIKTSVLALLLAAGAGVNSKAAQKFYPGFIKAEIFLGINGGIPETLAAPKYVADQPDITLYRAYAEYPMAGFLPSGYPDPANPEDGVTVPNGTGPFDNYASKLTGFFVPPTTADYVFFWSSDDNGRLWLSTDDSPANLKLIAQETVWSNPRQYTTSGGGSDLNAKRSDKFSATEWPGGNVIHLTAGNRYYIQGLGKEGGGGDNTSFTVLKASDVSDGIPADGATPATGAEIGVLGPDVTTILTQPASQTVAAGSNAKFSFKYDPVPGVDYTYQWTKGGTDIAGATDVTYATAALAASDSGVKYAVKIIPSTGATITSADAVVTVAAPVAAAGFLKYDIYGDADVSVTATDVATLTSNPAFPDSPRETYYLSAANSRIAYPDDSHERYGARMSGTLHVPVTGDYNLFISSDDASQLFLNTTGSALPNVLTDTPIAAENGCCNAFLEQSAAGDVTQTTAAPIHLTAGTEYGFVALLKEGGGGDYLQVAIRKSDDTTPSSQLKPIPAAYLATAAAPGGAVTITQNPANVVSAQNNKVTFSVAYTTANSPVVVQWQKDGVNIPFENGTNYVINAIPLSFNGSKIRAVVLTPGGSATSTEASVSVTVDNTPPTIAKLSGSDDLTSFLVTYSEAVTGADVKANYSLAPALTINSIDVISPTQVRLHTAKQAEGTSYTLTVTNVKDTASPTANTITAPNNTATAVTFVFVSGIDIEKKWNNIGGGTAVSDLTNALTYPNAPDLVAIRNYLSIPANVDNNYGATVTGYFVPPTTTDYIFFLASDDHSQFWLSTDDSAANLKEIAEETAWSSASGDVNIGAGQYIDSGGGSDLTSKRSDQFANTQWPDANTIHLTAGNKYYFQAIMKEGGGGDNLSVIAWTSDTLNSNPDGPADGATPLTGNQIGAYVDPATLPPLSPSATVDKHHFNSGETITFTSTIPRPGNYTYQWYRNKKAIAGATSATYVITNADYNAIGDYNIVVSNANGSAASNPGANDDNLRLIMNGAYDIELEDFNHNGGQHEAAADKGTNYTTAAYTGLIGVEDVDYNNSNDESGGAAFAYGRFQPTDPNVIEMKGGTGSGDNVNSTIGRDRGSFSIDQNFAIGWTGGGDWGNYTRAVPSGKYVAIFGSAYDGTATDRDTYIDAGLWTVANPTSPDGSTPGSNKGNQGLTKLGDFHGYQTGAWSSNDLVPLINTADGSVAKFDITAASTTFRVETRSGDGDFVLLYRIGDAGTVVGGDATISVASKNATTITLTFKGTLQSSSTVDGTFTDVSGATSPMDITITPGVGAKYWRTKK